MDKHGIFAVRICNSKKKETAIIGPQYIQIDRSSMSFVATFPGPLTEIFYSE